MQERRRGRETWTGDRNGQRRRQNFGDTRFSVTETNKGIVCAARFLWKRGIRKGTSVVDGLPFPRSSAHRDFTRVTRGWRLLRASAKARLYRCKSLFAGIYVRAKQVPGNEAPQYDNAITPPPSPHQILRCSQLPLPSSSSPFSVYETPSLFSPRISLLCPCRLLLYPAVNITIRKCGPVLSFLRFYRASFVPLPASSAFSRRSSISPRL